MTAQNEIVGLTTPQALANINKYGANVIRSQKTSLLNILLRQFKGNYLISVLVVCTLIAFLLGQRASSIYIFCMIVVSSALGFWNEYSAQRIVDSLLKRITPKALVKRDGSIQEVLVTQITIGDMVLFSPGSVIPADMKVLMSENLEVSESVLTGESEAVYKGLGDKIYMGTNVESGHGLGMVTEIGKNTKYGQIAKDLNFLKPETSFQMGLRKFGSLLVKVIFILAGGIFLVNGLLGRDWLSSLMFALAVAVGLTPELLPVIITLSLSHGAGKLSKRYVVVKQLVAVENLGNMDILCCDKTGTLTEGKIELTDFYDSKGQENRKILEQAFLSVPKVAHSAHFQNSIDRAIVTGAAKAGVTVSLGSVKYLDTEPFDYNKKASYNVVSFEGDLLFLVKGVLEDVMKMCPQIEKADILVAKAKDLSTQGHRVVALAGRVLDQELPEYTWDCAKNLTLLGVLVFSDSPKKDAKQALKKLEDLHVRLKVLTGDNELVALKVCQEVGLTVKGVVLGSQLEGISSQQLEHLVLESNLFARITPENKLTIIKTLQKLGHTVGFLGDGINDAPALHTADVGISVDGGADVAKESASIVLMRGGLDVITDGVMEGRRIFNNTVKYILMGTSSNFGNMLSASAASFVLPFLPMTPVQILLNNTLYDFSQITIPTDNVDKESLLKPRYWDINFIRKYMMFFGPISSLFDFITFFCLLWVFKFNAGQFQAGWFLESLMTQTLVIFAIRTAKFPFFRSTPSRALILSSVLVLATAVCLAFLPISKSFGFGKITPQYFVFLAFVVIAYMILVDLLKVAFIKKFKIWN